MIQYRDGVAGFRPRRGPDTAAGRFLVRNSLFLDHDQPVVGPNLMIRTQSARFLPSGHPDLGQKWAWQWGSTQSGHKVAIFSPDMG